MYFYNTYYLPLNTYHLIMHKLVAKILRKFADWVLGANNPKIIAITGSVGKTSTKDAIFAVLQKKFGKNVWKSYGNLNTDLGLPLAILKFKDTPYGWQWAPAMIAVFFKACYFKVFKKYPEILVLEYGADRPKDIKYLTQIAKPDVAVITSVGPAHLEEFKTIDNVAKEKITLAKELNPDGVAVLNEDNEYIKKEAKKVYFEIVWYHGDGLDGAKNAAYAVAKLFKISENTIRDALEGFIGAKGRLKLIEGINNSLVLDDTYNSNPLSVKLALEKIRQLKGENQKIKRTIIVLGDMLELGEQSDKLHKEVAALSKKSAKILILVGKRFEGMKCDQWFLGPIETDEYLEKIIKKGDLVLIKGSQGMRMEKVTEKIIDKKIDPKNVLVRQSNEWKNIVFRQP